MIPLHVCDLIVCMILRLESPTRTLTLEAPRGVEVNAGVGDFTASCRKDLLLQSSEGEVSVFPSDALFVCVWENVIEDEASVCTSVCVCVT